jgi:hypothetical protein
VSFQWYRDGVAIDGATGATLNVTNVTTADVGTYRVTLDDGCGVRESLTATLQLTEPVTITADPAGTAICVGDPLALAVVADGTPPLSYQWRRNGVDIPGATADSYSVSIAGLEDAGVYDVVVTNDCGDAASAPAAVDLLGAEIFEQPHDLAVGWGGTAVFDIQVNAIGTVSYQWFRDGEAVAGATSVTLTLSNVTPDDAGSYSVEVTHGCGTVSSMAATLAVTPEQVAPELPANGATEVPLYSDLDWTFSDGAESYDVYFGTQPNPPLVANVLFTTWDTPDLQPGRRYYWRINPRNAAGVTVGPVWNFATAVPQLPALTRGPVPADGAVDVLRTTTLTWQSSADAREYRVWLAPNSVDALAQLGSVTAARWRVVNLLPETSYFWRVDAINADGQTIGAVWQFTTGLATNAVPDDATPDVNDPPDSSPPASPGDVRQDDPNDDLMDDAVATGACPAASAGLISLTVVGLWRGRRGRNNGASGG